MNEEPEACTQLVEACAGMATADIEAELTASGAAIGDPHTLAAYLAMRGAQAGTEG